ncbi:MAG: hypothetical protein AB1486_02565 [Planctomycetota bacterium]
MSQESLQAARDALTRNAKITTVASLRNQGVQSVRVIRAGKILELIDEAVSRVLAQRQQEGGATAERAEIVAQTCESFEDLARQESALRDSLALAADLERRLHETRATLESEQSAHAALAGEITSLRSELASREALLRTVTEERDRLRAQVDSPPQGAAQASAADAGVEELRAMYGSLERELATATQAIQQASDLQGLLDARELELQEEKRRNYELQIQVNTLHEAVAAPGAMQSVAEEIKALKESLIVGHPSRGGEAATSAPLEKLTRDLTERLDKISRKVGIAASDEPAPDLERIFRTHLAAPVESNIDNLQVKERKGGSVAGALARIKALKQGASMPESDDDSPGGDPG